jgi:hypothetical protein
LFRFPNSEQVGHHARGPAKFHYFHGAIHPQGEIPP